MATKRDQLIIDLTNRATAAALETAIATAIAGLGAGFVAESLERATVFVGGLPKDVLIVGVSKAPFFEWIGVSQGVVKVIALDGYATVALANTAVTTAINTQESAGQALRDWRVIPLLIGGTVQSVLVALFSDGSSPGQGGTDVVRPVRGVVTANQANLAAFAGVTGGSPIDGVTYVAGDRVLLVGQTTQSQNGPYVVGAVAGGIAPLTRPSDWSTGSTQKGGETFESSEGTTWANSTWKVTTAGAITVDTTNTALYPKVVKGTQTLSTGTANVTNLYILAGAQASLLDTTAAASVKGVLTAGQGTGSFALTGTGSDVLAYVITNW